MTDEDRKTCETIASLVHGYWMEDNETIFCPGRKPERMENPLTSVDTCIAAWRELSEEQRRKIQDRLPAVGTIRLLDNPDAASLLATAIGEEVTNAKD